jgi:hypothetical protein
VTVVTRILVASEREKNGFDGSNMSTPNTGKKYQEAQIFRIHGTDRS